MAELKSSRKFCLKILYFMDKKYHFSKYKNLIMINNFNNKQRFGAGFYPFFLSTTPNLCLLFIQHQQGENT